jgi:4-methyl-5(b-hydroxyethyl)-thiazole monophosphate biosynthesis
MSVLIPLAEGVEELEAITLSDILRRAGLHVHMAGVGETLAPIRASRGAILVADQILNEALRLEPTYYQAVILPGGQPGTDNLMNNQALRNFLITFWHSLRTGEPRYLGALCAAPKVLAAAGLLANKRISVFPGALDTLPLENRPPNLTITQAPVTVDGQLITGRGPGSALAFALTLVEKLAGRERREDVEAKLL